MLDATTMEEEVVTKHTEHPWATPKQRSCQRASAIAKEKGDVTK